MRTLLENVAIFKVFLPALLFGPVLETAYNARIQASQGTQDASSLQEIAIPFFSSVIILALTSIFAYGLAWVVAKNKEPIVRALIWATITIGNNNLVLVVTQPLCNSFPPMMRDPKCFSNMTVYNALFSVPSTIFTVRFSLQHTFMLALHAFQRCGYTDRRLFYSCDILFIWHSGQSHSHTSRVPLRSR